MSGFVGGGGGGGGGGNPTLDPEGSIVNPSSLKVGVLANDAEHGNRGGGAIHAAVVSGAANGFMLGTDKAKLDGVAAGAQVCSFANVQTALGAATSGISVNAQQINGLAAPSLSSDAARLADVTAAIATAEAASVPTGRTVTAGNGLSGGGDLSANRSFAVVIADATHDGAVSQVAQTMAGAKTFSTSVASPILESGAANPSASGVLRLANTEIVGWRNAGNSADMTLFADASNILHATGFVGLYVDGSTPAFALGTTYAAAATFFGTPTMRMVNNTGLAVVNSTANGYSLIVWADSLQSYIHSTSTNGLQLSCVNNVRIMDAAHATRLWQFVNGTGTFTASPTVGNALVGIEASTSLATGNTFTLQGQNSSAVTSTGGSININPGTGTSADGVTNIQDAGTTLVSFGPNGMALTSVVKSGLTGGTLTLAASEYRCPQIVLSGTLTSNLTVVYPNASFVSYVDVSGLVLGAFTLTFQSGSATTTAIAASAFTSTLQIAILMSRGGNTLAVNV
jgi:hypothetical protein